MSDSDKSDLDDYFPSSSGSETLEYDITSDEEDSDCDYSLKDARRWVQLDTKNLQKRRRQKRETEFGWVAGGRLHENKNNNNLSCYLLKDDNSVEDTLKLFFELESLGIKDDPYYHEDDQAMNIFKETIQFNNERYVVELPFPKNWKELSDNFSVAKQRFQNLWRRKSHPITVQHLDSFMYVDDWITGQDTREEVLLISLHAENIMKEAGMEMRKWISNDTTLMSQWTAKDFDTYPVDTSVSLGSNKTKVLGLAWQTLDDCLTLDTKGLLEFISTNKILKDSCYKLSGKYLIHFD
ncbi:uncharacterized protein NPIL_554541 [Nephila pilipes]|uniref:Uncharacterized protein n=1 Tax=Nephila pilipes TaxID=299642 RepID=A0A8X6N1L1_NEPPI|nr:uncharacterized protein NPIL_554541 [Nephila pilipes]